MFILDAKKLPLSKWTAVGENPTHYFVKQVVIDEQGCLEVCTMESIDSHHKVAVTWDQLYDPRCWQSDWI